MFDLPDAKRSVPAPTLYSIPQLTSPSIRRADLARSSSSRSPSPDADLTAAYHARLARIYGAPAEPPLAATSRDTSPEPEQEEQEEEEVAFRLFGGGGARQIVIREEDAGEGGFLGRDPRVWVVGRAEGERRVGIEGCAVEGEEVRRGVRRRAWGLEVPWRVLVVKGGREKGERNKDGNKGVGLSVEGDVVEGMRKKPGKKRRIELRMKKRRAEEEKERKMKEGREKEEAEREKRTRRNREKKVKRKMKEKAEKAMKAGEGAGSPGVVDIPEAG
jgi:hypothetical protein